MNRYRHVLIGLANTPADAGLIRYAATVARLRTARELRFVHVVVPGDGTAREHDRALNQMQKAVLEVFRDQPLDAKIYFDVLKGPLEDRLLACALEQESDLVLVGHGKGRAGRKSLGRRLAMKSPCSVWMVPEGSSPTIRRILVPLDFSEPSADAYRVAAELANLASVEELLTLNVFFDDTVVAFPDHAQSLRAEAEAELRELMARAGGPRVMVRSLFEQGAHVAQMITRTAEKEGVDLIVMSTRGRSMSAAVLLGSVTEDAIIDTKLPLLVVKHFGAKMGLLQALLQAGESGPHYN